MLGLALAGLADSIYLTWYHYDPAVRACLVTGGCETVNTSPYAVIGPVPVAAVGVLGYLLVACAVILRGWGPPALRAAAGRGVYALSVLGTGFAAYLTAIEVFVIHAICAWCVLSAAIIAAVCVLAVLDLAEPSRTGGAR
jgi:uncharacterized membrane protein